MNPVILSNARIIAPTEDFHGSVIIEDGIITDIERGKTHREGIDLLGQWLAPGCIDIHSDYLEKELHPRPSASFPMPFAFHFMDQRAAACGLTTLYSAISFSENTEVGRTMQGALEKSKELDALSESGLIRHFIHSRLDPNNETVTDYLEAMKEVPSLKLVVVNESIPGQRQFLYEDLIPKRARLLNITLEESKKRLDEQIALRSEIDKTPEIQKAFEGFVPIGSHDDTTIEHVVAGKSFGSTLSEMPTTIEAARKAKELGMWVCMGAPNYVRGGSHCGNLSCHDAMAEGLVDMLCSDYHFPTMLTSVVNMMHAGTPSYEAMRYVALAPAEFLGVDDQLGSIEIGKRADLVSFHEEENFAKVSHLWVDGLLKFMAGAKGINVHGIPEPPVGMLH